MVTYVASYGKDAKVAESVRESLSKHEIEIVHTCLDLETAKTELPPLCAGATDIAPASGLGSNASTPAADRKIPQAVLFGGGFTDAEYEQLTAAIAARAPATRFVKVQKRDVLAAGSFGPNPDTIAKIYRKKLDAVAA